MVFPNSFCIWNAYGTPICRQGYTLLRSVDIWLNHRPLAPICRQGYTLLRSVDIWLNHRPLAYGRKAHAFLVGRADALLRFAYATPTTRFPPQCSYFCKKYSGSLGTEVFLSIGIGSVTPKGVSQDRTDSEG